MGINYLEACQMEEDEIMEANAALDIHIEQQNKSGSKPKGSRKPRRRR